MARRGYDPASLACERPQTQALDRAATGIGDRDMYVIKVISSQFCCHVSAKESKQ